MEIEELKNLIENCDNKISELSKILKIEEKKSEKISIQKEMSKKEFWDDKQRTIIFTKKLNLINDIISSHQRLLDKINSIHESFNAVIELKKSHDDSILNNFLSEIEDEINIIIDEIQTSETMIFFSDKYDNNNAYVSIHAGAGGTESCDWVSMLLRMYDRWFEKKKWTNKIIDFVAGEEVGIKSITKLVSGNLVYGHLKSEFGVHRLVRISPFDSNARRHTSFASIDITPEIISDDEIIINEKDLKIDTYKSSGAGGQHVNTTDSAIRITHIPTKIVVSCQNERSQHKNKDIAMNILKSKLQILERQQMQSEMKSIKGIKTQNCWGNQIRSYVLYPYKMVKDLRTNIISNDPDYILDGNLDIFVKHWLKHNATITESQKTKII